MIYYLLFQVANANTTAAAPAIPTPERQPAVLSLIYMGGLGLMILLLLLSLLRNRRKRSALAAIAPQDLPEEVVQRLGATSTNRGLRALRWLFVLMAFGVYGFHVYWAKYASEQNERFQQLSYKDLRNRRLSESTLRGWILDRAGTLDRALALYHREGNGDIVRTYPMDQAFAQIFGSDRGDPGLERALFGVQSQDVPEAWEVAMGQTLAQQATRDVRLTIDRNLQQAVVDELKKSGKHGAVVILNPQTGDVLAMYSEPSYSLRDVQDEATWIRLEANQRDRPLVSRATGAYYIPGSTFKTVVMTAAFLAGIQDSIFPTTGGGFVAEPGAKPILDDNGSCEVCGNINIETAYEQSSNQYFAQMAVKLGPERLKHAAQLLGIGTYDDPADLTRGRKRPDIWNASSDAIKRALAPRESTINTNPRIRKFDLALEGFGQGYAGQMTPFQMAMAASAIANLQGNLMKPKIEFDRQPEVFNQVMPPQIAAEERRIMGLVVSGGTGRGAFANVTGQGVIAGGKTGTAQKVIPVYDPRTGEPQTRTVIDRDPHGKIIDQHEEIILDEEHPRIDGWFLCIAPLDNPQLAMAVVVEGGGYGSRSAAPIAANLVLKARDLGLLGNAPRAPQPQQQNQQTGRPSRRYIQ